MSEHVCEKKTKSSRLSESSCSVLSEISGSEMKQHSFHTELSPWQQIFPDQGNNRLCHMLMLVDLVWFGLRGLRALHLCKLQRLCGRRSWEAYTAQWLLLWEAVEADCFSILVPLVCKHPGCQLERVWKHKKEQQKPDFLMEFFVFPNLRCKQVGGKRTDRRGKQGFWCLLGRKWNQRSQSCFP